MNTKAAFLKYMNSSQVETALANESPLLLPIGTLEPHGRHLPVGTDSICAERLAEQISPALSAVIAPTIEYGVTNSLAQTAPSSFFSEELYEQFLSSVVRSFINHGFKTLIIINGHGGNREALKKMSRKIVREKAVALSVVNWWLISEEHVSPVFQGQPGGHAAIEETAAIMHFCPDMVCQSNYSPVSDDSVPNEGIWHYPPPGEVLLKKAGEGQPCFDKSKCDQFMNAVADDIILRLNRWLSATNRIKGGLRP